MADGQDLHETARLPSELERHIAGTQRGFHVIEGDLMVLNRRLVEYEQAIGRNRRGVRMAKVGICLLAIGMGLCAVQLFVLARAAGFIG